MLSSQEPGQLTLVKCAISFSFPKVFISVMFFFFFLSCPRRFWFGGFVKNSRHSKLHFVSSMFSFVGIDVGGWETFIPWLSCLL